MLNLVAWPSRSAEDASLGDLVGPVDERYDRDVLSAEVTVERRTNNGVVLVRQGFMKMDGGDVEDGRWGGLCWVRRGALRFG